MARRLIRYQKSPVVPCRCWRERRECCKILHRNTLLHNTLQHTATHCNKANVNTATVCQKRAVYLPKRARHVPHSKTPCNTLQHTVTNCTTLQHTRELGRFQWRRHKCCNDTTGNGLQCRCWQACVTWARCLSICCCVY